jgi:ribosomal protein S18 acetylase RimI-like enzyme
METPLIRRAMAQDAAPLARVMAAAYAPFALTIPDLPDVTSGLDHDIADHLVWVAIAGQTLIGGLVAIRMSSGLHIANLAVHPRAGGQGIGLRFMQTSSCLRWRPIPKCPKMCSFTKNSAGRSPKHRQTRL